MKTSTRFNNYFQAVYYARRRAYVGDPLLDKYRFEGELIGNVLVNMKRGKAAGLDELTTEHVVHSHPVLVIILAKLFNLKSLLVTFLMVSD